MAFRLTLPRIVEKVRQKVGFSPLERGFGGRRATDGWLGTGVILISCHNDRYSGRAPSRRAGPHRSGSHSDQEQLTRPWPGGKSEIAATHSLIPVMVIVL
jgi:hypothetical protein